MDIHLWVSVRGDEEMRCVSSPRVSTKYRVYAIACVGVAVYSQHLLENNYS